MLGSSAAGTLVLVFWAASPAAAAPAAASRCATPPGGSAVIYSASDATPATVTTSGGSTIASITFTSKTYFDYLNPEFAVDVRNGNDGIKPSYTPPSFTYSLNGGSWNSVATTYDSSGLVGGDVWAAFLPQWKDLANGSVVALRMKITFNSSMPHGSYDNWFGMQGTEVCSVENLSPGDTQLATLGFSPAAAATTHPASPSPAGATSRAAGGSGSASSAAAAASGSATSTASASASATTTASGSSTPSADAASSGVADSPSATSLTDAQNAADRGSSGSGTLVWIVVLGALVVFGGVGGTMAALRRRARG